MKQYRKHSTYTFLLSVLFLWTAPAHADLKEKYTEQNPLTVVCDRDFAPFEFFDDNGHPAGLNVDVISRILQFLDIPHTFVMREWHQASSMFENRQADLIFGPQANFPDTLCYASTNVFSTYRLQVAYRKGTPPLKHMADLSPSDTLVLKENDYGYVYITSHPHPDFQIKLLTPREALASINSGHYKYFIWGAIPMKLKVSEKFNHNIEFCDIDIPAAAMHAVAHDPELINAIDDVYARFEQMGQLKPIHDHWLHPERVHDDSSPLAFIIIGVALAVALVVLILNNVIRLRVRKSVKEAADVNHIKELALSLSDLYVMEVDLATNHISNYHGDLLPSKGVTIKQLYQKVHPDDIPPLREGAQKLRAGEIRHHTMTLRWNNGTDDVPVWRYLKGHSVIDSKRRDYLFITAKDVTREVEGEKADRDVAKKYQAIFDTNVIAMSFYDVNGKFIDLNDNMRNLCNFDENSEKYFRKVSLFDTELIRGDYPPGSREEFHICQHMRYPDLGLDRYIEFRISPTLNDDGSFLYYIVTARDVTEERVAHLRLKEMDARLRETAEATSIFERQLHYLLDKSDMYVWWFDLPTHHIRFSRSLQKAEFSMSREEYINSMAEDDRADADRNLMEVMMKGKDFNTVHRFVGKTPISEKPSWFALSGVPWMDGEGKLAGYFGIVRNVTQLMETQEQLRRETCRAEQSGLMKSAYLANLSHEIRTPLNAIVGFSDLLQIIKNRKERQEFIRIIRNNCDMLLRLINDILEASNMGQALAIKPQEVDFAQVFRDVCQTLAQRVTEPSVQFIADHPYDTFPACVDKGRIQQVITNFVTNAVKYTHEGHIRVGYREKDNGIYIYCEDTGAGIPKDKQAAVFERFVKLNDNIKGTGLGLAICSAIAERSGGTIGVTSEGLGHGSTFWIWIPRYHKD
jgi:PAS domain-containing protein